MESRARARARNRRRTGLPLRGLDRPSQLPAWSLTDHLKLTATRTQGEWNVLLVIPAPGRHRIQFLPVLEAPELGAGREGQVQGGGVLVAGAVLPREGDVRQRGVES